MRRETEVETRDERSLLMYLESRSVDQQGSLDSVQMNHEDAEILKEWKEKGFVEIGRICSEDLGRFKSSRTSNVYTWVRLSPEAFELATELRRAKAERTWDKRSWRTTEEHRDVHSDETD